MQPKEILSNFENAKDVFEIELPNGEGVAKFQIGKMPALESEKIKNSILQEIQAHITDDKVEIASILLKGVLSILSSPKFATLRDDLIYKGYLTMDELNCSFIKGRQEHEEKNDLLIFNRDLIVVKTLFFHLRPFFFQIKSLLSSILTESPSK